MVPACPASDSGVFAKWFWHSRQVILACPAGGSGEMKRSGPVVVRGIHHSAFGNQEVDEGRLPCRTEGRRHGEGKRRGSPNPKCEATLFYPLSPSMPEVFFCLRGTRLTSSQTLQVQYTLEWPLEGTRLQSTSGQEKLVEKSLRCPQKIPRFLKS